MVRLMAIPLSMQSCQMQLMPFLHSAFVWQTWAWAVVAVAVEGHVAAHFVPATGTTGLELSPLAQHT